MLFGKERVKSTLPVDKGSVRVLVIGCVMIVAVMLIMCISSINIMKQAIVSKLKTKDMINLSQSYGAVIEGKIDRAVDASLILSSDQEVMNWIESGESDDRAGQDVKDKMADLVQQFGYETAFLVSNQTRHYWSYHDNQFDMLNTVSKDNPDDAWFFDIITSQKHYAINIDYNAELKNTYVWIDVLVGDLDHPIAITGLGMNLSNVIQELIAKNKENQSANEIWLVNSQGMVQLATDSADMNKNVKELLPNELAGQLSEKVDSSNFKIDEYSNSNGQLYDIAFRQIRDSDWKLVIQIPRTETTGFLSTVTWNIVLSGLGIIIIVLLLFFFLSHKLANPYKRALQLNEELEQLVALRTSELEERNQKIQDGIDYARSIQQTIFPSDLELRQSLKQHFVLFEPKDAVGGDFYWIKRVTTGKLLVVGDCTGHGVAGALMTTAVNAMLNQITEQIPDDPARILTELKRRIQEFVRKDTAGVITSYGLDAAVFFFDDCGTILYAGAALPAYIWDGVSISKIPCASSTIDSMVRKKKSQFQNQSFEQCAGLTFYVTTDGFVEQPGGLKKLPFGKTRFMNLLSQIASLSMAEQQVALTQALLAYQNDETRRDDVTVLGFQL